MTRKPPSLKPNRALLGQARLPFLEAEIQLVTPMFGGGAEPGVADLDYPVRGSTVRGHLRFWWRACNACRFSTPEQLFEAEAAIWGQAANKQNASHAPSAIDVTVAIVKRGSAVVPERDNQGRPQLSRSFPGYIVFPFQGQTGVAPKNALEGVVFSLRLSQAPHVDASRESELREAAEGALWAWVTFGGLGARTRRGCGALYSPAVAPGGDPVSWLRRTAAQHCAPASRTLEIPVLKGSPMLLGAPEAPVPAWNRAAGWLRDFRQGVGSGRQAGRQGNRPGRSNWPEPEAVRAALQRQNTARGPQGAGQPFYPRADLGLPIIFQRIAPPGRGDPTLEASEDGATRFASPVIVKPFALSADRAVPMVVVLNAPHIWEAGAGAVRLRGGGGLSQRISGTALHDPARSAQIPPMNGRPTAREAFLDYVGRQPGVGKVVTL